MAQKDRYTGQSSSLVWFSYKVCVRYAFERERVILADAIVFSVNLPTLSKPARVAAEQMPTATPGVRMASSISASTPGRASAASATRVL